MSPDVAIVGGGVIGCAIAYALARMGGRRIAVFDKSQPGAASNAAAGILAVASSRAPGGALFDLRRRSAAMFPDWVEQLRADTDIDVEYREQGLLDLAFGTAEADRLTRLAAKRRQQGFPVECLDSKAAAAIEPGLSSEVSLAALFPTDRAINNGRLVEALHRAAERRGVQFRCGVPLNAVETVRTRAVAITVGNERFTPGTLVIAAGVWSRDTGALLRLRVPVHPDKGEILVLRPQNPPTHTLSWNDGYLVPRNNGEVLVGSTSMRGSFDITVTEKSQALLLRRAAHMVPALADAPLVRSWAGLRPCATLRRPIIGFARGYENVILATGHHRSGILLAPITGQLVAELIVHNATTIPLQPFCHRHR